MISFRLNIFVAILSPLKCPLNQVCYLYNCSSIIIRNDISYSCICWGRARCPRTLLFLNVCLANLNVRVMHKKKFKGQLKPVFYGIWLLTQFIKGPSYISNNILIPWGYLSIFTRTSIFALLNINNSIFLLNVFFYREAI